MRNRKEAHKIYAIQEHCSLSEWWLRAAAHLPGAGRLPGARSSVSAQTLSVPQRWPAWSAQAPQSPAQQRQTPAGRGVCGRGREGSRRQMATAGYKSGTCSELRESHGTRSARWVLIQHATWGCRQVKPSSDSVFLSEHTRYQNTRGKSLPLPQVRCSAPGFMRYIMRSLLDTHLEAAPYAHGPLEQICALQRPHKCSQLGWCEGHDIWVSHSSSHPELIVAVDASCHQAQGQDAQGVLLHGTHLNKDRQHVLQAQEDMYSVAAAPPAAAVCHATSGNGAGNISIAAAEV